MKKTKIFSIFDLFHKRIKVKTSDNKNFYDVPVYCNNCGYTAIVFVEKKKHLHQAECPKCMTKRLMRANYLIDRQ